MVSDTSDGCLNSKMRSTTLEEDMNSSSQMMSGSSQMVGDTSSSQMEQESSQNTSDPPVVSSQHQVTVTQDQVQVTVTQDQHQVQVPGGHMSQDTQSQPATQPLDMSDMEQASQCQEETGVWGQLYPHCGTFPR